jgi:Na+-driven multidrug efflux pump
MDTMKKVAVGALLVSSAALPLAALAQNIGGFTPTSIANSDYNVNTLIDTIISYVFGIILVVAVVLILYAAFLYLTSAGEEENIKKAKNYIIYAIIGIVIAFLARAIVGIVAGLLA